MVVCVWLRLKLRSRSREDKRRLVDGTGSCRVGTGLDQDSKANGGKQVCGSGGKERCPRQTSNHRNYSSIIIEIGEVGCRVSIRK